MDTKDWEGKKRLIEKLSPEPSDQQFHSVSPDALGVGSLSAAPETRPGSSASAVSAVGETGTTLALAHNRGMGLS